VNEGDEVEGGAHGLTVKSTCDDCVIMLRQISTLNHTKSPSFHLLAPSLEFCMVILRNIPWVELEVT
jgi:hypothetical protein